MTDSEERLLDSVLGRQGWRGSSWVLGQLRRHSKILSKTRYKFLNRQHDSKLKSWHTAKETVGRVKRWSTERGGKPLQVTRLRSLIYPSRLNNIQTSKGAPAPGRGAMGPKRCVIFHQDDEKCFAQSPERCKSNHNAMPPLGHST